MNRYAQYEAESLVGKIRGHSHLFSRAAAVVVAATLGLSGIASALTVERCVSQDNHAYMIITTGSGNIGTMVTSVGFNAGSPCSLSEIGPAGTVLTAFAAGPGPLLPNRVRTQVISGLPDNTISCSTNFNATAAGGKGALTLPGGTQIVSADPNTTTEPLVPVTTGDTNFATDPSAVPPAVDILTSRTITESGNPVVCSGNAMVFPIGGSGTTFSDPNTGEVANQSVTLDDTSGTRIGNPTSQPSRPDGFLLQGNCSNPATCQTIVFIATMDGANSFGTSAAGFTADGSFMQNTTEGAQQNQIFNTVTPTETPTITPTADADGDADDHADGDADDHADRDADDYPDTDADGDADDHADADADDHADRDADDHADADADDHPHGHSDAHADGFADEHAAADSGGLLADVPGRSPDDPGTDCRDDLGSVPGYALRSEELSVVCNRAEKRACTSS